MHARGVIIATGEFILGVRRERSVCARLLNASLRGKASISAAAVNINHAHEGRKSVFYYGVHYHYVTAKAQVAAPRVK